MRTKVKISRNTANPAWLMIREIRLNRPPNEFDELVLEFVEAVEGAARSYVIVAGYVAILFGRPRMTDEVDVILEADSIQDVYRALKRRSFEVLTLESSIEEDYRKRSVRFYKPPNPLPNFEVKAPRNEFHYYSLRNRVKVSLGSRAIYISPLELQIAYKLYLGSMKDLEDAKYIYEAFRDEIDRGELEKWARRLNIDVSILEI